MTLITSADSVVLLEISERIATIILNRPSARNALSSEVLKLLPQLMKQADASDDVDVIILVDVNFVFDFHLFSFALCYQTSRDHRHETMR